MHVYHIHEYTLSKGKSRVQILQYYNVKRKITLQVHAYTRKCSGHMVLGTYDLGPPEHWDHGFESYLRHGHNFHLFLYCAVSCR
jgi:hypothetical protein